MSMVHMVSSHLAQKEWRVCPSCQHRQSVLRVKAKEAVACTKCGTKISPERAKR
jgi:ribosomal protein S27E